ncbi:MAG TPA: YdiU family protein [Steroidobacteraceae bacterium]|nr:YdiU family protein [Steroidobacteraceae bacterium]
MEGAPKIGLVFADGYARLPAHFYTRIDPTRVAEPRLIKFNSALAAELGLDVHGLGEDTLAAIFSGNLLVPDSHPIATAYAGHQFGQFVPQLGDGRAILLGEVHDRFGRRREIQLKGSGRTPYSRSGDGRAALGPVLREYVVSEAMHTLGVPTTRALAAVATGEVVYREQGVPGAILTRVAASHVRVGTFQYFAARGDTDATKQLADYVIARHYPEIGSASNPYLELLRSVMQRQARLVAGWMNVGFIHGVMNTDNMAISGETIDFGPCAFMDDYDPATVFSSIDAHGRYAYANQPAAAQWNLARFAETLLAFIDSQSDRAIEQATAVIADFSKEFDEQWLAGMRRKLGLFMTEAGDAELIGRLLDVMKGNHADFTLTFRRLCAAAESDAGDAALHGLFAEPAAIRAWVQDWRSRLAREPQPGSEHAASMRSVNPVVIPRNHRIEAVIVAAVEHGNFAPFEELSRALSRPYEDRPETSAFADPPLPDERVLQTFCGT